MYAVADLWIQAEDQHDTFKIIDALENIETIILKGYKISNNGKSIIVQEPLGDYYKELNKEDYALLFKLGWRKGVLSLLLKAYQKKLDKIQDKIKFEKNYSKGDKLTKALKSRREWIMKDYHKITVQISKLK